MTATLHALPATDEPPLRFDPFGRDARRPPELRATVHRPRLHATLSGPVVVIVAPAGYGKTTLLCEWSARDPRPFAWVTLDARHNDPRFLLRSISRALDDRAVLILDDVHTLTAPAAHDILAALATQPPEGMTIAFASRSELPLPVGRLRAQGLVTELRAPDLAMSRGEAGALSRAAGLELDRDELDLLLRRTEGWPVGLMLATLSLGEQPMPGSALARFGGDDRLVAEYLRQEVLGGLAGDELAFVIRTSVLDVLTAPLCEAVLEQPCGAAMLGRLVRAGFPLVALDRTAERYRHHRLLADMLRVELHRTDPAAEPALHRRASAWHAAAGDGERALHHALAADEIGRAGDLVWADLATLLEHGASAPVERWLSHFSAAQLAAHPRLALTSAGVHLAHGRGDLAEHWIGVAASRHDAGHEVRGGVAALRAALGRDGLARMREDAADATELLAEDSSCQSLCDLVAGVAAHLQGDTEPARRRLEAGARRAAVSAPQLHALCLSQLALMAADPEEAGRLAARARAQVTRHRLERYPTTALVLAVSALVRAQRGRIEDAHGDLREAASLLGRLTDVAPWYVIECELVLARAALRLSDVTEARARLEEARRHAACLPEAIVLHAWLQEAEAEYAAAVSELPSSLTTAELRILHVLPTHLSFREIAERACVSTNTVKTQANAVYRKLDVRSRSDAVTRARQLGLLSA